MNLLNRTQLCRRRPTSRLGKVEMLRVVLLLLLAVAPPLAAAAAVTVTVVALLLAGRRMPPRPRPSPSVGTSSRSLHFVKSVFRSTDIQRLRTK